MSTNQERQAAYRLKMTAAIERLQHMEPKRYAELLKRAQDAAYDAKVQREAYTVECHKREEAVRLAALERARRFNKPVVANLPDIDMSTVHGMVAFRVWEYDSVGLRSTAMHYHWREVNFADRVPDRGNNHGFYCIKLTGLSVLTSGVSYFGIGRQNVSGFVELCGKVMEHTDGILRAEVARLVCLFVTSESDDIGTIVSCLHELYPVTPVYVLNPEQLADVVMREVLRQKYLRGQE